MTKSNKNIEHLFQNEKSSTTELSKNQVENIINQLPNSTAPSLSSRPNTYLNLKNIIMISIPTIAIATAILLSTSTANPSMETSQTDQVPSYKKITKENQLQLQTKTISPTVTQRQTSQEVPAIDMPTITQNISNEEPLIDPLKNNSKDLSKDNTTKVEDKKQQRPSTKNNTHVYAPTYTNNQESHITSIEARRLKKALYKNLIKDGIIKTKNAHIEIALKPNTILVNSIELDQHLIKKYQDLTHHVGTGKNRKIIMNPAYIRVGDFTDKGFKGIGFGRFQEESNGSKGPLFDESDSAGLFSEQEEIDSSQKSLFEKRKAKLAEETKNLNLFVESIYSTQERTYKRSLFGGNNINDQELKKIHQSLYELLIQDGFISSKKELVVLEIAEDQFLLNLSIIPTNQIQKYEELVAKFKLKRKNNRMIKMSANTIAIGDYQPGSFTGTFMEFLD